MPQKPNSLQQTSRGHVLVSLHSSPSQPGLHSDLRLQLLMQPSLVVLVGGCHDEER